MLTFDWPLIGHTSAVQFLQTALRNNTLQHAYLFCGPEGVGKTTLANFFVRSLLCQNRASAGKVPCTTCSACRMLEKRIHPDVIWVQRGQDERVLSIDAVRALLDRISTTSFLRSYKVALISEADHLTLEAANALLKMLEEPPANTVFILTAESSTLLPATILSRVQAIPLRVLPAAILQRALESEGIPHEAARTLAGASYGRPGRMRQLLNKEVAAQWHEGIMQARVFVSASAGARLAMIPKLLKDYGEELALTMLTVAGREALLHNVKNGDKEVSQRFLALCKGLHEVPFIIGRNTPARAAFEYASCIL